MHRQNAGVTCQKKAFDKNTALYVIHAVKTILDLYKKTPNHADFQRCLTLLPSNVKSVHISSKRMMKGCRVTEIQWHFSFRKLQGMAVTGF